MAIQTLVISCPDCGEELKSHCYLLNGDPTEFHIEGAAHMEFECDGCDKTYFIGEIEIWSEDEL